MNGLFEVLNFNDNKNSDLNEVVLEQRKIIHNLSAVLDNLPGSIYWKNKEGIYLGHNAFARNKMKNANLPYNYIAVKTDYDLFPPDIADNYRKHDLEVMEKGIELSREEKVVLPNGELLVQLSSKRPLLDENDNIIGIIGNTVDITHIKKIEEELRIAKDKSEKANHFKTEFMRNMEHDIRTPFNGIWVLAGILEAQEEDPHKKEYLSDISKAAKELLDYCNDILHMIKVDFSEPRSENQLFNFKSLIENVIVIETVAAKNKNIQLKLSYSDELPPLIIGDSKSIQRILLNLVSNAIKFTEQGYVEIQAQLFKKINKSDILIALTIEDTGAGLSSEKIAFISEKISGDIALNEILGYNRQGLGLPVVKQLVHRIAGDIKVSCVEGKGTKFVITLPLKIN